MTHLNIDARVGEILKEEKRQRDAFHRPSQTGIFAGSHGEGITGVEGFHFGVKPPMFSALKRREDTQPPSEKRELPAYPLSDGDYALVVTISGSGTVQSLSWDGPIGTC